MGTHPIFESDFDCLTDTNRKGKRAPAARQKMHNPMGMPEGGIPPGQFLGIGNPNGAVINFNTAELEDELADLLGEGKQTAAPPAQKKKGPVPWDELDNMINDCMVDIDDDDEDIDDPDSENELEGMLDQEADPVETPAVVKPDIDSPVGTPTGPTGGSPDSTVIILEERISQYKQAVEISEGSKKK